MIPSAQPIRAMTSAEWGLLVVLSVLWGGSFFFTGVAVREVPPLTLVLLRVGLAALILLVAIRATGVGMPSDRRIWAGFLVMGLIGNVIPFGLLVWGQSHIASGLASILNATTPLATIIVAHFLTVDERLTSSRVAAVALGIAGVVVMIGPDALRDVGVNVAAQLACIAAGVSYAFAVIFGRRFARLGVTPIQTATGQVTGASVILLPLVFMIDRPWTLPMPGAAACAAIVGLAVVSTALAYVIYFRLLSTAGATRLTLVTFLIPVSAILLGWLVLGEQLHPRHFAGMALIGAGLVVVDGRFLRSFKRVSGQTAET